MDSNPPYDSGRGRSGPKHETNTQSILDTCSIEFTICWQLMLSIRFTLAFHAKVLLSASFRILCSPDLLIKEVLYSHQNNMRNPFLSLM